MNRINLSLEKFASAAPKAASLATLFLCLTLGSGKLFATEICHGGSVIRNSAGTIIGCGFTTWGPSEQSMCNGNTVFSGPNAQNCHVCVAPPYDQQVAADNFSGLSASPAFDFHCLKCTPPPDGLTAWWTLDETVGISTVHDFTNNLGYDGIRYGATTVSGHDTTLGANATNANHFNGLNQYIEIPANDTQLNVGAGTATGSGDFSVDAWVKIDSGTDSSGVRVIVEKRTQNGTHYKGYSFYLYNRYLGLQLADDAAAPGYANYGASALVVPADGQWHFVAVSVKREPGAFNVQFTLDNAPVVNVSSPARGGDLTNTSPFRIGMVTIGTASVFNGSIDEVEFFSRALASPEFQSIYNAKCYGKCKVAGEFIPTAPSPTCTWDPVRRIWDNCTN